MATRWASRFNLRKRIHAEAKERRGRQRRRSRSSASCLTRATSLFEKDPNGTLYLPFAGGFQSNVFFHIKFAPNAGRDAGATADLIRRTVREVDTAVPMLSLKTFAQHLDGNIELWIVRAGAALFSIFGGLALVLATVGVYGVKAYSVARRTARD